MTVPERIIILCPEYCHNFINTTPESEVQADLNAIKIYLHMKYPVIEGATGFLGTFMGAPTKENQERYQMLEAYIDNYHYIPKEQI